MGGVNKIRGKREMWDLTVSQLVICLALAFTVMLLCLFGLNNLLLLCLKIKPRKHEISIEKFPEAIDWPFVTVQVATYNEGRIVSRLIESCLNLNYPANKFEIVVVDDSTDETINILRDYERRYYPRIKVIHRSARAGYKAGALNEALKYSRGDLILILDADSVPEKDFLRKTVPLFLADEKLGFVQGKPGYLNAEVSWLNKTFALVNDWFAVFIQSSLSKCGGIMSFIGHAGVFRRKALEDAGGWMSDTITEDMDMAYRIQLMGWKATFADDAISLEEVPPNYYAAVKRFKRHIKGVIQNLIKHSIIILKHKNLSCLARIEGLIQLSYPLVYPLGLICLLLTVAMHFSIPGAFIDHFWLSPVGLLCSLAMLLTFPYIALIVSFITSTLVITIISIFASVFLFKYRSDLRGINLKTIFGVALVWNDNILNCLAPILEIVTGKESIWLPTERSLNENRSEHRFCKERFKEAILRIFASTLVFVAFALSSYFNFSFNSFGLLVPAVLWICSAYLILRR